MAALSSAGSPATRGRPTPSNQFQIHEDSDDTLDSPIVTRQMVGDPRTFGSVYTLTALLEFQACYQA